MRHIRFSEMVLIHGRVDLIGEDLLEGLFLTLFQIPCAARKSSKDEPIFPFFCAISNPLFHALERKL